MLDEKIKLEIQKFYKISKFVNRYGKFLIVTVISLLFLVFYKFYFEAYAQKVFIGDIDDSNIQAQITDEMIHESEKGYTIRGLLFNNELTNLIPQDGLKINIIGSNFLISGDSISYNGGLINNSYGIILPININTKKSLLIKDFTSKKGYKDYIDLLKEPLSDHSIAEIELKETDNLIQSFHLGCIYNTKMIDYFCNLYVNEFLEKAKKYIISQETLLEIFKKINISDNKKCNTLIEIAQYQKEFDKLKWLVSKYCNESIVGQFVLAKDFYSLLSNGLKSTEISGNKMVDLLKLTNIERKIILRENENPVKEDINTFIILLSKLLNTNGDLYFKNNSFVVKQLVYFVNFNLREILQKDTVLKEKLTDINKLLYGKKTMNIPGLYNFLTAAEKTDFSVNKKSTPKYHGAPESFSDMLSIELGRKTYFKYTNIDIVKGSKNETENRAFVDGFFSLAIKSGSEFVKHTIKVQFQMILNDDLFRIEKFVIKDKELNDYFLRFKPNVKGITLGKMNQMLKDYLTNFLLYGEIEKETICAKIKEIIKKGESIECDKTENKYLKYALSKSGKGKGIESMIPKNIKVTYYIKGSKYIGNIKINKENFIIKNKELDVSYNIKLGKIIKSLNKRLTKKISYSKISTIKKDILKDIQNQVDQKNESIYVNNDVSLKIDKLFEKYFGTAPLSNKKIDKNYVETEFKLGGYLFLAEYNVKTRKIRQLSLKYVDKSGNNKKLFKIKGISFKLNKSYQGEINYFTVDTDEYIKKYDKKAFLKYIKISDPKRYKILTGKK